jgi:hypothetical protein
MKKRDRINGINKKIHKNPGLAAPEVGRPSKNTEGKH